MGAHLEIIGEHTFTPPNKTNSHFTSLTIAIKALVSIFKKINSSFGNLLQ